MISFYLFWCLGYFLLHAWLAKKWPKRQAVDYLDSLSEKVTLIIPFRNEKRHIPILAEEIRKIAAQSVEVVLVDDHSEDQSLELLMIFLEGIAGIRFFKSPGQGKKAALSFGISQVTGGIILTSDADCMFPENWAHKIAAPLSDPKVQLVAGPVLSTLSGNGFFQKFQQIEWFSILLMTQASFARKQPLMCSGANLAFRKSAFLEVGGYNGNEHVLSGDDEFLLKKIVHQFGSASCRYLPSKEVLVYTAAQSTWIDLLSQRIRWAGKWKVHQSFSHASATVFAFLVQLIWLGSVYIFGFSWETLFFLVPIWGIKVFSEMRSLGKVKTSMGMKQGVGDFVLTAMIHPFYVIAVGMGTLFIKVKWKGRTQEDSLI
jgi:poly-beta-1,6-N-acetyl-D-glucosamine synthase